MIVLLIEDNSTTAKSTLDELLAVGITGARVRSIATACTVLREIDTPFDVVISDIGLPNMSGIQGLPLLREATDAPVVAYSGLGMDADALRAGFDAIVAKPDTAGLIAAIRRLGSDG